MLTDVECYWRVRLLRRICVDGNGYFTIRISGYLLSLESQQNNKKKIIKILKFLSFFYRDWQTPIVDVIPFIIFPVKELFEHLSEIQIIWFVFESQRSAVVQVCWEFDWQTFTEDFNWCRHFLLHDFIVLFLFIVRFDPLPRQITLQEIHQHISDCF